MSMILIDGFDHGDVVDVWTFNGGNTPTTSGQRTGTHYLAMGINQICYRALGPTERDDGITMGGAAFMGSNALDGSRVVGQRFFEVGGGTHIDMTVYPPARSIRLIRGDGTLLAETDPNILTWDTWHYIETGVKIADAGGTAEVRLNGATVLNFTGDTRNGGAGIISAVGIIGNGFSAQTARWEDIYILNEQGSAPWNTFLGDTRCFPLYPIGNGFYAMLVGSDGNSTDNYLLVDETGTPVSSDYVESLTPGDKDSYALQDLSVTVGTIRAVELRMYAAKNETGTKRIRSLIRRSSTDAFGADHVLAEDSYATYRDIWEQDPLAGPGAWTITNVNAMEIGVEVRA